MDTNGQYILRIGSPGRLLPDPISFAVLVQTQTGVKAVS